MFIIAAGIGLGRGRGLRQHRRAAASPGATKRRFSDSTLRFFSDGSARRFSS
jgi:hypothetical protein